MRTAKRASQFVEELEHDLITLAARVAELEGELKDKETYVADLRVQLAKYNDLEQTFKKLALVLEAEHQPKVDDWRTHSATCPVCEIIEEIAAFGEE